MNCLVEMGIDETLDDVEARLELSARYPLRGQPQPHDAHVIRREQLRSDALWDAYYAREYDRRLAMEN